MARLSALSLCVALGLTTAGAVPTFAQSKPAEAASSVTLLTLSALGEVKVKPDTATLTFGVMTEAKTADEAMRLNREQMSAAMAALKSQNIPEKNIATSGLNLNARYDNSVGGQSALRGYAATNTVRVSFDATAPLAPSIDAVVKAGVNQIFGITFGLKDSAPFEDSARRDAIKNLTDKANLYAQSVGKKVKRLTLLAEGSTLGKRDGDSITVSALMRKAATPIAEGELTITMTVSGQFELE